MNYNFTDSVRRALAFSRDEAIGYRHDYVGTEHILLGLTRVDDGLQPLKRLRLDPEDVRDLISRTIRKGKATIALGELPYTSRAKKVLEFAMNEAKLMGHNYVGTEHLLVGLMREEKGIAAQVLNELGVTLNLARKVAFEPVESEPASGFHVRVDDKAEISIYEQIVARVQEGIATGELQPGERLPTVRHLADQLDIAPGTVARAYSELERRGVVVTEGTRGTRVADRQRRGMPDHERPETLVGLLRPVVVAAFHLGATPQELVRAFKQAMKGIFKPDDQDDQPPPKPIDA